MNIEVSNPAFQWFKKELDLQAGDTVRFFARYGGCSTVQSGFSLGMGKECPKEIGAKMVIEDITFFIEKEDLWFFDGRDLTVSYSQTHDEIEFGFVDQGV